MYDNFFDWWEAFTELAYSKKLEISASKEQIRDQWYDTEDYHIEDAIKNFTR